MNNSQPIQTDFIELLKEVLQAQKVWERNDLLDAVKKRIKQQSAVAPASVAAKGRKVEKAAPNTAIVELSSCGNPDFNQYAPISERKLEAVTTYSEAVAQCLSYIRTNDLGGGNWNGGFIYHPSKGLIAFVSYNGRVWAISDKAQRGNTNNTEITDLSQTIL